MPLAAGERLDQYEIIALIGKGGMGEVYKARDTHLDRDVAIKVLPQPLATEAARERFQREARAASALNHPNIAHVYELGDSTDRCYIAMEFVDGETLRRKIYDSHGTLSELIGYLQQAAAGLAKAHSQGVIHRDLKPDNIMVTRDGYVKVLDFGLAKLMQISQKNLPVEKVPDATQTMAHETAVGIALGTVNYMSPEQAEGRRDVDERSDIFSFGCVLFEAVTRKRPFAADSVIRIFHNLLYEPTPRIVDYSPEAPPELQDIVDRCTVKDPSHRTVTMVELSRDLKDLLQTWQISTDLKASTLAPVQAPDPIAPVKPWKRHAVMLAVAVTIVAAVVVGYLLMERTAAAASVAVIPFVNGANNPDSEYLSDGITESLISALAEIPGVKVTARTSSFKFKGKELDVRKTAAALGVRSLVMGRLAPVGTRLHVTADLVNGMDGTEIWGGQYDSEISGLPNLQVEISKDIAEKLRSGFTKSERQSMVRQTGKNAEAYALLLRGRYQLGLYTPDSTQKAADLFEQAVAADPEFAMPRAELAHTYRLLSGGAILDPLEMMPKAEEAARKALELDGSLAEAHAALGDIKKDMWDWKTAEKEYRRALESNPNLPDALDGYAILLSDLGRHAEAISKIQRLRELDPLAIVAALDLGAMYYNAGRYQDSLDALKQAVALDPSTPMTETWSAIVYGGMGRFEMAIPAYRRAIARGDKTAATECYYAYSLARSGRREESLQIVDRLRKSPEFVPQTGLAVAYVGLDDKEAAIHALQQAFGVRDPMLQYLDVEPHFNSIRADPRFRELVKKVGLP